MELRQLRYFQAVAEELNISHAAARLHVAQPHLSQQIIQIERELGVRLLIRTGRGVRLTSAGAVLRREAHRLLQQAERAATIARAAASGHTGLLQLCYPTSGSSDIPIRVVRAFRQRFPQVLLETCSLPSAYGVQELMHLRIDACFIRPPLARADDLMLLPLTKERMVSVVPVKHSLAGRRSIIADELADEPVLLFPRRVEPGLHDSVVRYFERATSRQMLFVELEPDEETMIAAVRDGAGASVVTESRREQLAIPGVVYRPFEAPQPETALALSWRREDDSAILAAFVSVAQQLNTGRRNSSGSIGKSSEP